jgi:hypothetical protein
MTARGKMKGGVVVLEEGASLPDGVDVLVEVIPDSQNGDEDLRSMLLRHAGKGQGLPSDLATHHDHYAHGKPKP